MLYEVITHQVVPGNVVVRNVRAGTFRPHEGIPVGCGIAVPPADADMLPHGAILVPEADTGLQRDLLALQQRFDSRKLPAAATAGGLQQCVTQQAA